MDAVGGALSEEPSAYGDAPGADASSPPRWPLWSSRLHESLDSQESVAAELRRAVEDLRRSMDEAPTPEPPPIAPLDAARAAPLGQPPPGVHRMPPGRWGHQRVRLLLVAAAVVVLVVAAAAAALTRKDAPPAVGARSPQAVSAPPMPAWPGTTTAAPPDLPAHGAGADTNGVDLVAAVSADRAVDIYERAVLSPAGTVLTLRTPSAPALLRSLGAPPPAVRALHAEIDGRAVPVVPTTTGWTVTAPPATTPTRLVLRYQLTGALVREEPAPPGRFVLVLTPLATSLPGAADAVVVRIRDPRVEQLYCPDAGRTLCGSANGDLHTATVPKGAPPVVVALVTFPRR